MVKKSASYQQAHRRKIATGLMIVGILLVAIAAIITIMFIQPTDFKSEYKKRQLSDCLKTTTDKEVCSNKYSD